MTKETVKEDGIGIKERQEPWINNVQSDGDFFWDSNGVVLIYYLRKGKIVLEAYYISLMGKSN